ncbi:ribosome maturation factor RimP [Fusobacterium massiliense]|jgi:ribosome maturation factor rimP|uniref:ribosome maturation factor RimP n=1 Tax=Fusobacterium massiliense TaxID=1852365 RepID=UPI00093F9214|nr:ribosome maturation factor RimP [Fusobacterium massiliense]
MEDSSQIIQKIEKIVNPFINEMNLSLVDVEYLQESGYWYVRIFIENLNGDLTLEDCSKLSSLIDDKIEELIEHKFFLEVSSPGIERPLKKIEDYIRFKGQKILLNLKNKLNDKKQMKATILDVKENKILFLIDKKEEEIDFDEIGKANILFEFNDF